MKTIETIKQMIADGQISQEVAEKYFPELRESEDERIRKELTEFLKSASGGFLDTTIQCKTFGKWLTWFEKQGEQKSVPDWMPKFLDELRSKKNYFDWDEHKDIEGGILAIIKWMNPNYFNEKDGEQKPVWNEEDEDLLKCTINNLTELEQRFGKDYGKVGKCINWIKQRRWKKSLKTADLENSLCDIQDGYSDTSYEYRVLGEAIEFIRSTDDPHAWRPSEEQITWLYRAADDASKDSRMKQILNELLSDLKKLREG